MLNEDRQQELDRLLDGDLADAERARALEGLESDPEAIDWFADRAWMNAQLQRAMQRRGIETGARSTGEDSIRTVSSSRPETWRTVTLAVAAMLMLGVFVWLSGGPSIPAPGIARVIRVEGEVMADGKRILSGGDELFAEENLTMTNGLIELAFRESGVHLLAAAPLSMKVHGDQRVYLRAGEVKLVVPPQGIGFVVETWERKITDLGTSFVVAAREDGSKVLVLDGRISVDNRGDNPEQLLKEGDLATFDRAGEMTLRSMKPVEAPERTTSALKPGVESLPGRLIAFTNGVNDSGGDVIGRQLLPLVRSGFRDESCLDGLKVIGPVRFAGIAGTYDSFPKHSRMEPYVSSLGWLAWHGGLVKPRPGRYRFWGYADNHLLVAVNGTPVFEGCRYDSEFRKVLGIARQNHPSLPCLNARAGFASGEWFEVDDNPIRLDLLFGEQSGTSTAGLLLVEREGDPYEETSWGQPKWPLFLTERPSPTETVELEKLRDHMEKRLLGSFSIDARASWPVAVKL
jgi:ferric-dicitrate binding protein FerR (iron transport regulator)